MIVTAGANAGELPSDGGRSGVGIDAVDGVEDDPDPEPEPWLCP